MKKILGIVVLGLLLFGSTYAENLGIINVKELTKLKTKQIIELINNKKLYGHYDKKVFKGSDFFEEYHADKKYITVIQSTKKKYTGKWKAKNDKLCYIFDKSDCIKIYINPKKTDTIYFVGKNSKVFAVANRWEDLK